jgi:small subunit ribosomal protein S6
MTDETTHYETLFIVNPVHSGRNQDLCERFRGVLEGQGATVTHFEEWGMRDLAYPIEKQGKGFYNLIQYKASAGTSDELERLMRLSDEVMRCMTVVLDDDVRSLAPAEEPALAPEPAAAPAPEPVAAAAPEPAAEEPVEEVQEVKEVQEGPEA